MPYHHVAMQLFLSSFLIIIATQAYPFRDVSRAVGLLRPSSGRTLKYGGAGIADLDGDGYPDLLCVHHDQQSLQVYFNLGNGRFRQSRFIKWLDNHALNPIRLTPFDRRMHFVLSEGGSFGLKLKPPHVFRITKRRDVIVDVSKESPDLQFSKGRGRSSIFLSLHTDRRMRVRPDMLATNADGNSIIEGRTKIRKKKKKSANHFAFQVYPNRTLHRRRLWHRSDGGGRKFAFMTTNYGGVTDIDNDGTMEVILLAEVSVWKLVADFTLQDITMKVVPRLKKPKKRFDNRVIRTPLNSATAFAELDYDNDGDWDLFFTQSAKRDMPWKSWILPRHDILLRNNHINNKNKQKHTHTPTFTDASVAAGIPRPGRSSESTGVTVGDFDNDGWIDIFIVRYDSPSSTLSRPGMILLRNQGNGRFRSVRHGFTRRGKNVSGDMATAVDYDLDGRIDLVVSEGSWFDKSNGGFYRVLRNVMITGNGFLLVRVKNGPNRRCTSLHAVVVVFMGNGRRMMRRVGSPGTAVAVSYIETVHFGLGKVGVVKSVRVKWVDGTVREKIGIRANSTVSFGVGW